MKAGKAAQRLRELAALMDDWVQFPASTWLPTTSHDSSSRVSDALFRPLQAPGTILIHIHTCRENMCTHKRNTSKTNF